MLIQFLIVLFVGCTTVGPVEWDKDGTPKWGSFSPILVRVAFALKWVTFIIPYGVITTVFERRCGAEPQAHLRQRGGTVV